MTAVPRRLTVAILAVTALVSLAACSSSKKSSTSSSDTSTTVPSTNGSTQSSSAGGSTPANQNAIDIASFKFSPNALTVAAGATVSVKNSDTPPHTVTSDDGTSFDTKTIAPGSSMTFTAPSKAGTYPFHCSIHPNMKGTLTVS